MSAAVDPRRLWPYFWAALGAIVVVVLVAMLGAHQASPVGIERALKARVEAALDRAGVRNVSVEMDGQTARLYGVAENDEARIDAVEAALAAAGPGGPWAGGVTRVDAANLRVGRPVSPYSWRIVRRENGVAMSGSVPTPRIKQSLLARARAAFDGVDVVDETRIAPGAPNAQWAEIAGDAIDQLALLRRGEARLNDARLVILGDGEVGAVEQVTAFYNQPLPAPYRARVEATVTGEGLGIADLGDVDLSEDADPEACQAAFRRMMERNVINFASASAEIDATSLRLLDQLASIALRCDSFSIEIAGHTDNVGPREANVDLSNRRARAVGAYLIEQGVSAGRLTTIGHGPDHPRQSNASAVGRAANRRIEFTVRE